MEEFIDKIISINDPKILFILCGIFIFADIITGYLKALKLRKINSSISRDGYIKKVGWIVSLIIGCVVDLLVDVKIFLIGSAIVCIITEAISFYENLGQIGIDLPFKKYFEKIKEDE